MKNPLPIADQRKLTILFRVESGCLGSDGRNKITEFCLFAQTDLAIVESNYIHWKIVPRIDKTLSELQFEVAGKVLPRGKAEKYLNALNINIDAIEGKLFERITYLIEQYLGR